MYDILRSSKILELTSKQPPGGWPSRPYLYEIERALIRWGYLPALDEFLSRDGFIFSDHDGEELSKYGAKGLAKFIKLVRQNDRRKKTGLAAIAGMRDETARPLLVPLVHDPDQELAGAACRALAYLPAKPDPGKDRLVLPPEHSLEEREPELAATIKKAAVFYEPFYRRYEEYFCNPTGHLIPRKGVRFYYQDSPYGNSSYGRWWRDDRPPAAVYAEKTWLLNGENAAIFFEPLDSAESAYELATFLPSHWSYAKGSVERESTIPARGRTTSHWSVGRSSRWIVRVAAVNRWDKTQRTVFTFGVSSTGRIELINNSNPTASPNRPPGIK